MIVVALTVFFVSLAGVAALFGLKIWEARRGVVLAEAWRLRADLRARTLKRMMLDSRTWAEDLPPLMAHTARYAVHEGAIGFAALARALERGAYKIADLVSHKHRFEPRAPKSEFLQQVIDHKNGNGDDSALE